MNFTIPEKSSLIRAYANGLAIPFKMDGQTVTIEVLPSRTGDKSGSIKLVINHSFGHYLLAGTMNFLLPKASWPILEIYFDLHLPKFFNYKHVTGTMEAKSDSLEVKYYYDIPESGTKLSFHQFLITTSAPDISLNYTVDITKKYYTGKS